MAKILIAYQPPRACQQLAGALAAPDVHITTVPNPLLVPPALHQEPYDVVITPLVAPAKAGLRWLTDLRRLAPELTVIVLTGPQEHTSGIDALKLGAFDVLAPPLLPERLFYSVQRALTVRSLAAEYTKVAAELTQSQDEVRTLQETVAELIRGIEKIRRLTEKKLLQHLRLCIVPLIAGLRQDAGLQGYGPQLARVAQQLEALLAGADSDVPIPAVLSLREIQTALMIRHGLTNEEIAAQLHISPDTVKAHRRNIRKKLGLQGTKNHLATYLHAL
jgi:DNA-binding NarL/FixJ family response regulator